MQLLPGAEPFRLEAGPGRALLLHGFASTPFELRYLAERLQSAGYGCVAPLLPGHGTAPEHLARIRNEDWIATAQRALERLGAEVPNQRLLVVGQSLGALLGLLLAARAPARIGALVVLAPPLQFAPLTNAAVAAYRFSPLRLLNLSVPRAGGADIGEPRLRRGLPGYDTIPLRAAAEFARLQQKALAALPRVTVPLLALHGQQDRTVPLAATEQLICNVASKIKRVELLPDSAHVLSLDVERHRVASLVVEFAQAHCPQLPVSDRSDTR